MVKDESLVEIESVERKIIFLLASYRSVLHYYVPLLRGILDLFFILNLCNDE